VIFATKQNISLSQTGNPSGIISNKISVS